MQIQVTDAKPIANQLLAALPPAIYRRLMVHMETVMLTFGEVLYEPGETITHVYFPINALVSLLTRIDHHPDLEVGLVGHEGMVGVSLALGVSASPVRALVQGTGTAMRMKAAPFLRKFMNSLSLRNQVHLYTHVLLSQVAQTAACNRFHSIEARLARWLLMSRDGLGSDHFHLTQELLGNMLGVRRAGITKAANSLKSRKLIDYRRGEISILDGVGLEAAACSCYATIKSLQEKIAMPRPQQRYPLDQRLLGALPAGNGVRTVETTSHTNLKHFGKYQGPAIAPNPMPKAGNATKTNLSSLPKAG